MNKKVILGMLGVIGLAFLALNKRAKQEKSHNKKHPHKNLWGCLWGNFNRIFPFLIALTLAKRL